MFFLFFFSFNFCGFKTLAIFSFFEASFSNLHKRKEYWIFFPNKFLATLRKPTPKINHWPKPLFSGLGYHSDNGTSNAISDQVPQKKIQTWPYLEIGYSYSTYNIAQDWRSIGGWAALVLYRLQTVKIEPLSKTIYPGLGHFQIHKLDSFKTETYYYNYVQSMIGVLARPKKGNLQFQIIRITYNQQIGWLLSMHGGPNCFVQGLALGKGDF